MKPPLRTARPTGMTDRGIAASILVAALTLAAGCSSQSKPSVSGSIISSGPRQSPSAVNVAAVDAQNSAWRVDAIDTWLDPVPRRDVADGPRMRVTVTGGCPSTDKGEAGVTNEGADLDAALLPAGGPTAGLICYYNGLNGMAFTLTRSVPLSAADAARVAVAANASQLSHLDDEHVNCPSDDGSQAVLAFSYSGRTDVDLDYALTGCSWVANGHIVATPSDALSALVDPRATAASASP